MTIGFTSGRDEASIFTPDQRVRVFVSSTLEELAAEREAAREAIVASRFIPVMFELGARPHPPRALYRAYLEQSHVFVGVYCQRYGWIAPGMEISGLEDEFELAGTMPKLVYLKRPAGGVEPRLADLIRRIGESGVSYRLFDTPEELAERLRDDLAVLVSERFAATAARVRPLSTIPTPISSFVGRTQEVETVVELLRRPDTSLLTLTGPGGIGKTRLALEAARALFAHDEGDVVWVELASLSDSRLVMDTIAQTLGARESVAEHIGERELVLLLDNFEHVIEAASDLTSLRTACPNLTLLVTSRELLRLQGEIEYPVPPLAHADAVSLFCSRSGLERSEAIGELCNRLDNLPLAVELAAGRTRVLSPEDILARLASRLDLFTGSRDADPRQRTLRATIDWSFELLSLQEQELFACLSVFRGGGTLEAAETVCSADLDTLEALVNKSLLRHAADRYWMLETIREFADEQLSRAGEREAILARHADYYLALAEKAEPFFGTSEEAGWLHMLARDHDNFRAALAYAADSPLQLRLACALWKFWSERGHHSEGRRWLEAGLAVRDDAPTAHVAHGLRAAAVFARVQGDLAAAERLTTESIEIAKHGGHPTLEMHAAGTLANIALTRRDYPRAAELQAQVEALARELGDDHAIAVTIANRAYLAVQMSDFDLALTLATESIGLSRKLGDSANVVSAGLNLALAAHGLGDRRGATEALIEAIERARALGHRAFLVDGLIIAAAVVLENDPGTAAALITAADRAQTELSIELDPVERDLRASVEAELPDQLSKQPKAGVATDDLHELLVAEAARALRSLAVANE